MESTLVTKWKESGLLEGLEESLQEILAQKLEEAAVILTNENCTIKGVDTVAFPAIRRVLNWATDKELNVPEFLSELSFDYNRAKVEFHNYYTTLDGEADFTSKWCEKYIKNTLNNKRQNLNEEAKRWQKLAGLL